MPNNAKKSLIAEIEELEKRKALIDEVTALESQGQVDRNDQEDPDYLGAAETAARSSIKGASFGISEPVISGIVAGGSTAKDALSAGKDMYSEGAPILDAAKAAYDQLSSENLGKNYDADQERRKELQAKHPIADLAGEIGGSLAGSFGAGALLKGGGMLGRVLSAPNRAVDAIGRVVGTGAEVAANAIPMAGKLGAVTSIAKAGAQGVASGIAQQGIQEAALATTGFTDPNESLKNIRDAALLGGEFGAKFEGAVQGLKGIGKAAKFAGPKLLNVFTGVNEETQKYYLENMERVKSAKSYEDVVTSVENVTNKVAEDLAAKQISVAQAKKTVEKLESELTTQKQIVKSASADEFRYLNNKLKTAKQDVSNAEQFAKQEAKASAEVKLHMPPVIAEAMGSWKQRLNQGKEKAFDALSKSQFKADTKLVTPMIDDAIESVKLNNTVVGSDDKATISKLEELKNDIESIGILDAVGYRKLVDKLDNMADYSNPLKFDADFSKIIKGVRTKINDRLKFQSKDFEQIMSGVAEDAKIYSTMMDVARDKDAAYGFLARMENPRYSDQVEALKKVLKNADVPFDEFEQIIQAKRSLKDPRVMLSKLPAKKELSEVQRQYAQTIGQARSEAEFAQMRLQNHPEISFLKASIEDAQKGVQEAEEAAFRSRAELGDIAKLDRPQIGTNIKRLFSKDTVAAKEMFRRLSELSGQDFEQVVRDMATADSFNKQFVNGSRNVRMYAGVLTGLYSLFGGSSPGEAGGVGFVGSLLGGVVDKYGPRTGQKILEGISKVKGLPTVNNIRNLNLPPQIKEDLESAFRKAYVAGSVNEKVPVGPDMAKEIQASNLRPVLKAKAMNQINRDKSVDASLIHAAMMGEGGGEPVVVPPGSSPRALAEKKARLGRER